MGPSSLSRNRSAGHAGHAAVLVLSSHLSEGTCQRLPGLAFRAGVQQMQAGPLRSKGHGDRRFVPRGSVLKALGLLSRSSRERSLPKDVLGCFLEFCTVGHPVQPQVSLPEGDRGCRPPAVLLRPGVQ